MNDKNISQNDQANLHFLNQQEIESKQQLNNEIIKLREQMNEQQNNLFNQINSLKQETQNANAQRFEALKEIEKLKDELSKQKYDEEIRRKYVYDVIADEHSKTNVYTETHLPDVQIEKVVLPVQNEKNIYYDERLRHPNRIIPIPKLTELNENGMKTDSRFIDLDTHNVISGLELYQPNNNNNRNEEISDKEINHKGFSIDGDYGTLRSYYHNNTTTNNNSNDNFGNNNNGLGISESNELPNNTNFNYENNNMNNNNNNFDTDVNKNIENNVKTIEDENLEVNKIYNKNMDRIRFLNEIEGKINQDNGYNYGNSYNNKSGNTLEEINKNLLNNKENFDDFINKINETCK